ncbi:MspA family porin [Williamsia sp. CHRR-6]|uniref:MspA family porin n=1 Tax=Williamsia sp. CHRR-6 TaxID=2835871 RepID=UPI001BD9E704|nr:MspA family porin [Williamsia sp. CHRR-6]MBT0568183.1 MspA family porin [Williamsia sp. CHRR-6]
MSKNSTALRRAASLGTMAMVGATAVGLVSQGAANADTFIKLPNGAAKGDDLAITRTHEKVQISPSLAANGIGRNAWVSADITVYAPKLPTKKAGPNRGAAGETALPGTNSAETTGAAATVTVGYIIGCQIQVNNLVFGGTSGFNLTTTGVTITGGSTLQVPLAPGQVNFVVLNTRNLEKAGTYYLSYDRAQLQVQNCAGYAQARSYSVIETTGDNHQKVTLYGKPFPIG